MKNQEKDIKELYKSLKKGDVKLLAMTLNVSTKLIWLVANKRVNNQVVMKAIEVLAKKRIEEGDKKIQKLKNTIA